MSMLCRKALPRFKTRLFSLLLTIAMALSGVPAFAKMITFDFEQPGVFDSFSITNTTTQGVTFSPNCHIDWGNPLPALYDSTWIGFDTFGCGNPLTTNPNYLGPNLYPASIFVFFESGPFSLRELTVALPTWKLTSSNGGFFDSLSVGIAAEASFVGPAWTDVAWLLFYQDFESGSPSGFDNLIIQVPEPATLALLGLVLAGLALNRRRRLIKQIAVSFCVMALSASASATLLTFDETPQLCIGGPLCVDGIDVPTYKEKGYTFAISGPESPHTNDGGSHEGTLWWHCCARNAELLITLTRNGGGLFDLIALDIDVGLEGPGGLGVSAPGHAEQIFLDSVDDQALNFLGVSQVFFRLVPGVDAVGIDNLLVKAASVAEPAPLALIGIAIVGLAFIRRRIA